MHTSFRQILQTKQRFFHSEKKAPCGTRRATVPYINIRSIYSNSLPKRADIESAPTKMGFAVNLRRKNNSEFRIPNSELKKSPFWLLIFMLQRVIMNYKYFY